MDSSYTGGCQCGAIQYVCSQAPRFSVICQCRQCQRITGSGHAAQFAVERTSTTITGTVQTFALTSDAGNQVESAFCGQCGSPLYKTTSMMPNVLVFHVGSLDDPSAFKPQMVVHSESGHAWDTIDPAIPRNP
ncbi:MAG: GFA family protein [Gammaproteobacteria bacterium]|nr:GFA family protein [Gammaproteobacteria bacterium]